MLFRIIIFIFTIFSFSNADAQRTRTDTVYVYEKVIVRDTVFLEKAIKKRNGGIKISLPTITDHGLTNRILLFEQNIPEKTNRQNFQFGVEGGIGFKEIGWAENMKNKRLQPGENAGIWVSKSFSKNFSVMLSANMYYWNSTFDLDGTKEDTFLNGFYFTTDSQPLLFQKFNNRHFEYTTHLKFFYEWKKFRPFVGIAIDKNSYKMQFVVPENQILNKLEEFRSKNFNLGLSFGLQYRILPKILLKADYQQYALKNLSLKNSAFDFDIFKTNNTFTERKMNLGISYVISK